MTFTLRWGEISTTFLTANASEKIYNLVSYIKIVFPIVTYTYTGTVRSYTDTVKLFDYEFNLDPILCK